MPPILPSRCLTAGAALLLSLSLSFGSVHAASDSGPAKAPEPAEPSGPMWDVAALGKAPGVLPAEPFRSDGLKAVLFEGVPYKGKPTRVFAWMGIPKVEPGKTVPGIVLVHGGGGTAFEVWTKLWVDRGYAAIALDTSGSLPVRTASQKAWERNDAGGPPGWGGYNQIDEPRTDQWTYHAAANTVLAHSLLRSQPGVDPQRIGITGISWGGYLTSIVAGVDERFAFAVPVYGCGFTNEHGFADSIKALGTERGARWMRWWDPSTYLPNAKMPILWINGTNDFAYTMNAHQKSYLIPKGPRTLCIRARMPHSHEAGWEPAEIQRFADSIVNGGPAMAKISDQGGDGNQLWVTFTSDLRIIKAELHYTKDTGRWQDRKWEMVPADLTEGRATATLPEGARVYFFNVIDERGAVVSSAHVEKAE